MWILLLAFLSFSIFPQNSVCTETKPHLEDISKRLQDLENKAAHQESVIEELRKTNSKLCDSNEELRETNTEIRKAILDLRATNAGLKDIIIRGAIKKYVDTCN
ncbi:uncharacterized protein LOC128555114 [Mercenaria mercenaria]|uniref:uncharacterized protein LOC128555114 n=1 Tax=Mercenaria mercenaria TaxID=6596 RepID=UPI00234F6785|nr:uncharacterized protein LOC128555114 [Mercenaria mercenaria]